eukprot:CAMPEP_0183726410 /NCGR_PEP_ID=MMETSP0737-20130205/23105_1 /TAXON_ID=385413 /ORGANISM="Thalassiosira miniscula, Strain CCMP1093" /LENGTH=669 /DNA_ID=CAMNT_0025957735 /DNA_START=123 /DNA_END=2132 /DNA_ORIENTATION=-
MSTVQGQGPVGVFRKSSSSRRVTNSKRTARNIGRRGSSMPPRIEQNADEYEKKLRRKLERENRLARVQESRVSGSDVTTRTASEPTPTRSRVTVHSLFSTRDSTFEQRLMRKLEEDELDNKSQKSDSSKKSGTFSVDKRLEEDERSASDSSKKSVTLSTNANDVADERHKLEKPERSPKSYADKKSSSHGLNSTDIDDFEQRLRAKADANDKETATRFKNSKRNAMNKGTLSSSMPPRLKLESENRSASMPMKSALDDHEERMRRKLERVNRSNTMPEIAEEVFAERLRQKLMSASASESHNVKKESVTRVKIKNSKRAQRGGLSSSMPSRASTGVSTFEELRRKVDRRVDDSGRVITSMANNSKSTERSSESVSPKSNKAASFLDDYEQKIRTMSRSSWGASEVRGRNSKRTARSNLLLSKSMPPRINMASVKLEEKLRQRLDRENNSGTASIGESFEEKLRRKKLERENLRPEMELSFDEKLKWKLESKGRKGKSRSKGGKSTKKSKIKRWHCSHCGFSNELNVDVCEVCNECKDVNAGADASSSSGKGRKKQSPKQAPNGSIDSVSMQKREDYDVSWRDLDGAIATAAQISVGGLPRHGYSQSAAEEEEELPLNGNPRKKDFDVSWSDLDGVISTCAHQSISELTGHISNELAQIEEEMKTNNGEP